MFGQVFFLRVACGMGAAGVIAGAFGAHGLEKRLSPEMLNVFEVAVRYHIYHALALLAIAAGADRLWHSRWTSRACWAMTLGIVVFSGSLYALALTDLRWLGAITPIGGLALILGWGLLLPAAATLDAESQN